MTTGTQETHHDAAKRIASSLDAAAFFSGEVELEGDGKSAHLFGSRPIWKCEVGISVEDAIKAVGEGVFSHEEDWSIERVTFSFGGRVDELITVQLHLGDDGRTTGPVDLCLDLYIRRDAEEHPAAGDILKRLEEVEAAAKIALARLTSK